MNEEQAAAAWQLLHHLQGEVQRLQPLQAEVQRLQALEDARAAADTMYEGIGHNEDRHTTASNSYLARKATAPPHYSGHQAMLRPSLWLKKCDNFFKQCHSQHVSGEELITFATSLLDGPAAAWWEAQSLEAELREDPNSPDPRYDWQCFKSCFTQYFTAPGQEDADRDRLATCRQHQDVSTYNAEFMYLIVLINDWSESAKIHHYIRGLKHPMQEMLKLVKPARLTDAMQQAIDVESAQPRINRPYVRNDYQVNPRSAQFSRQNTGVAPMELGNMFEGLLDDEPDTSQFLDDPSMPKEAGNASDSLNNLRSSANNPPPSPCPLCKGMHWKRDCPRYSQSSNSRIICHNCKKPGHKRAQCPALKSNTLGSR